MTFGGAGSTILAAVSQTDIALWASGLTTMIGAVLWIHDKWTRNRIATESLRREAEFRLGNIERETILRDSRMEITQLEAELRETRDKLLEAKIEIAKCQALLNQTNSHVSCVMPQIAPHAPSGSKSASS